MRQKYNLKISGNYEIFVKKQIQFLAGNYEKLSW